MHKPTEKPLDNVKRFQLWNINDCLVMYLAAPTTDNVYDDIATEYIEEAKKNIEEAIFSLNIAISKRLKKV